MWCILCRMLFVVLCSEWAVCVVLPCGVLCKLLSCAELSVCADSRRRGPFGGKRARLAVHQTCSASPRKLLRSRIDQFCHAACCFARRLKCNCSVCCGSNSSKLSIRMLFLCMSECPWRAAARQVPLSALRRTTGVKKNPYRVKKNPYIALTKSRILAQLPLHLL